MNKDDLYWKKSIKSIPNSLRWCLVIIVLLLLLNVYQGLTNNKLKDENRILGDEIESLEKENAGLLQNFK